MEKKMNKKQIEEFMEVEGKEVLFNFIKKATENNIGATMFCFECIRRSQNKAVAGILRMIEIKVTGDKLYMLWNDCCSCNFEKTMNVMLNNSTEDIFQHINYDNGRGIEY